MKSKILGRLQVYGILIATLFVYIAIPLFFQLCLKISVMTSAFLSDVIILGLSAMLYFKFRKESSPHYEAFKSKDAPTAKQLVLYFLYFVAITLLITIVFTWYNTHFTDPTMTNRTNTILKYDYATYMMLSCFVAPLEEEFMNRLFLYNMMKTKVHWLEAAIVTSFAFGALHGTVGHIVFGSLFGLLLALAYERTKIWIIPVLGHMTYNISLFVMPSNDIAALSSVTGLVIVAALVLMINLAGQIFYIFRQKQSEKMM